MLRTVDGASLNASLAAMGDGTRLDFGATADPARAFDATVAHIEERLRRANELSAAEAAARQKRAAQAAAAREALEVERAAMAQRLRGAPAPMVTKRASARESMRLPRDLEEKLRRYRDNPGAAAELDERVAAYTRSKRSAAASRGKDVVRTNSARTWSREAAQRERAAISAKQRASRERAAAQRVERDQASRERKLALSLRRELRLEREEAIAARERQKQRREDMQRQWSVLAEFGKRIAAMADAVVEDRPVRDRRKRQHDAAVVIASRMRIWYADIKRKRIEAAMQNAIPRLLAWRRRAGVAVRRRAAAVVLRFLRDQAESSQMSSMIRAFKAKVVTCQHICRSWLAIQEAYRTVLMMQWARHDAELRVHYNASRPKGGGGEWSPTRQRAESAASSPTRNRGDSHAMHAEAAAAAAAAHVAMAGGDDLAHSNYPSPRSAVASPSPRRSRAPPVAVPRDIKQQVIDAYLKRCKRDHPRRMEHWREQLELYESRLAVASVKREIMKGTSATLEPLPPKPPRPRIRAILSLEEIEEMHAEGVRVHQRRLEEEPWLAAEKRPTSGKKGRSSVSPNKQRRGRLTPSPTFGSRGGSRPGSAARRSAGGRAVSPGCDAWNNVSPRSSSPLSRHGSRPGTAGSRPPSVNRR